MSKLFAVVTNVAIIALLAGSMFSGQPSWTNPQAALTHAATTAHNVH